MDQLAGECILFHIRVMDMLRAALRNLLTPSNDTA
jgi:hypothetical protein